MMEVYRLTNREAFHQYIRKIAEKQIASIESMSDEDLVQHAIESKGFGVHIDAGNNISYFKAMTAGMPIGPKSAVLDWFKKEAPDQIRWDNLV